MRKNVGVDAVKDGPSGRINTTTTTSSSSSAPIKIPGRSKYYNRGTFLPPLLQEKNVANEDQPSVTSHHISGSGTATIKVSCQTSAPKSLREAALFISVSQKSCIEIDTLRLVPETCERVPAYHTQHTDTLTSTTTIRSSGIAATTTTTHTEPPAEMTDVEVTRRHGSTTRPLDVAAGSGEEEEGVAVPVEGPPRHRLGKVADYMTKEWLVCFARDTPLEEAIEVLITSGISGAPVTEKYEDDATGWGRLVGVFSEEDVLWKEVNASDTQLQESFRAPYLWSLMTADDSMLEAYEDQALKVLSQTVGLSMSDAPICVTPETPMREAASVMLDAKVKRLPVIAPREGGKPGLTVVGVLSRMDVLRHVAQILRAEREKISGEQPEGEGERVGAQGAVGASKEGANESAMEEEGPRSEVAA